MKRGRKPPKDENHAFRQRMYRLKRVARLGLAAVREEQRERAQRFRDRHKEQEREKARP